ncbi:helix-turn-helix domain-containing protein [Fervidibacillus halotolerans]|uniref:Helix-turn-helix transcriptional regulator n=1 Tax=Fervidibacillus halotolerans TaxID=2980027 RepID=A0A9E8M0W3_9BACI|nr:helix-turn-helix transcriptional regulator [Fervidibacillus halotolerans]WAA13390.1 helix-turn-helix transcriptional regulator [Fervidibacillus halotolerans]
MKRVKLRIDELLAKNNLTQAQLSEMTGVRQAAISQLSRGFVSRVSIEHIEKIANALDIDDINEIMTLIDGD